MQNGRIFICVGLLTRGLQTKGLERWYSVRRYVTQTLGKIKIRLRVFYNPREMTDIEKGYI